MAREGWLQAPTSDDTKRFRRDPSSWSIDPWGGAGGEHFHPLAERLIAGHKQQSAFVAVHHQLKEHRGMGLALADGALAVAFREAAVVNHQQVVAI